MSGALTLLLGIAFIGLSIFFKFMPRTRVVAGLVVGSMLAGVVTHWITRWFAEGIDAVSPSIAKTFGQSTRSVEVALPTTVGFILAVVVIVFLKGKGGGKSGGKSGGGKGGGLAHAALVCALLLPIVVTSLGSVIRSVS